MKKKIKKILVSSIVFGIGTIFLALVKAESEDGYSWVPANNGTVALNAFIGGSEPGRALYICRASHEGGIHPGKLVANYCNIGWAGTEIQKTDYETLVLARPAQWLGVRYKECTQSSQMGPDGHYHTGTSCGLRGQDTLQREDLFVGGRENDGSL